MKFSLKLSTLKCQLIHTYHFGDGGAGYSMIVGLDY